MSERDSSKAIPSVGDRVCLAEDVGTLAGPANHAVGAWHVRWPHGGMTTVEKDRMVLVGQRTAEATPCPHGVDIANTVCMTCISRGRDGGREALRKRRERANPIIEHMNAMTPEEQRTVDELADLDGSPEAIAASVPNAYSTPALREEWHEDIGAVLWWRFPVTEPPYAGTPLDDDFPYYLTHWTRIDVPSCPHLRQLQADGFAAECADCHLTLDEPSATPTPSTADPHECECGRGVRLARYGKCLDCFRDAHVMCTACCNKTPQEGPCDHVYRPECTICKGAGWLPKAADSSRAAISVEDLDDVLALMARAHALLEDEHPRLAREMAAVLWPTETLFTRKDSDKKGGKQ